MHENGQTIHYFYNGKLEYAIIGDAQTGLAKENLDKLSGTLIGKFMVDFLNFDMDYYRYGEIYKGVRINSHDFSDCERNNDGTLTDSAILKYKDTDGPLPHFLNTFIDTFMDTKNGKYIEEGWENIRELQNSYKKAVDYIFEVHKERTSRKRNRPKKKYFEYFELLWRQWRYRIPDGEYVFESLQDALLKELHFMAESEAGVFICKNCKKYTIGPWNSKYCERTFKLIDGSNNILKLENDDNNYLFTEYAKRYLRDQRRYERQEGMYEIDKEVIIPKKQNNKKVEHIWRRRYVAKFGNRKEPKINRQSPHIDKKDYIKLKEDFKIYKSSHNKALQNILQSEMTCGEYTSFITMFRKNHLITLIKNKHQEYFDYHLARMAAKKYAFTDLWKNKEKHVVSMESEVLEKETEFIKRYDNALDKNERKEIQEEYERMWKPVIETLNAMEEQFENTPQAGKI